MVTAEYLRQQRSGPATQHLYLLLGQKVAPPIIPPIFKRERLKPSVIMFHRSANIVFKALLPEDRERVSSSIERLKQYWIDDIINEQVQKIIGEENLYILQVSDFRILLLFTGAQIAVQDIFTRNRLTHIFGQ